MHNKIEFLDDNLIDKIAAGEVIERPASIVKELVENSIDAGAKNITIEIKNGGTSLIKITDDGLGIEKDQVEIAFLRHATSKLKKFEEIGSILTLGFRGEALSSIASVSQLEMFSKNINEEIGSKIVIEGGKILSNEDYPALQGTTFIIKNIFFNTPVRKKFLKKESVESGYISDIINRFAIGNPHISFKYINNSSVILNTSGNKDLKTAIFYVYGKEIASKMIEVNSEKEGFVLSGFIASPEITRGNRTYSNLFINGRYVKSKLVQDAIEEAYLDKIMSGKFPIFALNIKTPKDTVDINVHPTKMEVRFENETFIFDFIKESIAKTLKTTLTIPSFTAPEEPKTLSEVTNTAPYKVEAQKELKELLLSDLNDTFKTCLVVEETAEDEFLYSATNLADKIYGKKPNNFKQNFDKQSERTEISPNYDFKEPLEKEILKLSPTSKPTIEISEEAIKVPENNISKSLNNNSKNIKNIFNSYKIIGQLFNTYWIVEKENEMFMIDQHALHEKYLYEMFINKIKTEKINSQPLLTPLTLRVTELENEIIKQNLTLLESFGFKVENFGVNSYIIREVPFIFNEPTSPEFFIDIIDILSDKTISNVYELKLDKIASISCKSAIKGNNKISIEETEKMLNYVLNLENPFNCPHGRPTIVKFTKYEIEKMFKRIQN